MPPTDACPQCQEPKSEPSHTFCTNCGLALKQRCTHCAAELLTPSEPFTKCHSCKQDFWSCSSCGRLYHFDRTSCENSYCPEKNRFWTTRFGRDEFHQTPAERCLGAVSTTHDTPRSTWIGGVTAASDLRWPSLHTLGLILSVQESGVVELWAERGAPRFTQDADFTERSVCLSKLDLGQESTAAPFLWHDRFYLPGTTELSVIDMTSSPSIGQRIDISAIGRPVHWALLTEQILVWGELGLGALDLTGGFRRLEWEVSPGPHSRIVSDGKSQALLLPGETSPACLYTPLEGFESLETIGLTHTIDYALHAEHFILIAGNQLAYLEEGEFHLSELPASVIAEPIYCLQDQRLTLILNDNSIRTCSSRGDRFSFVSESAGTPSTSPLKLGDRIYYGIEGRYLCRDEEALRPRLSSAPVGALSYANGRIFGVSRDGSLFCFEM